MPVVISLLNAFTGLAAAATGFELENNVLIVSGMLVGASGTLLTLMMGRAMNRSIANVLFSAFGQIQSGAGALAATNGTVRPTTADDVAVMLAYAQKVVVVPGYGMAVAQAQHDVRALADLLEQKGVEVTYAIHPVAGRMPGHMNVLLAEANVPYPALKEMDEANAEFPRTDVSLVIGANDVVNPDARENRSSPIYGMPILNVDESKAVIVLKRSMNPGFAGRRQPAFRRAEHDDAVRRREGVGRQADGRGQDSVTSAVVMDRAAVEAAVSPERAVDAVRAAFVAHARGDWSMPPKVYVTNYPAGDFRAMPALGGGHALLKWITSFPGNPARGLPTVSGVVLVSDASTGELQAVLDAASVTALRTGAAAVLAAETLGRDDAETAAVVGAGVNGRAAARTFLARGRSVALWDVDAVRAAQVAADLGCSRRRLARGGARGRPARHGDAGTRGGPARRRAAARPACFA